MAKKAKKNSRGKKIIAGALVAAALATTGWWVVGKNKVQVSSYVATQIVDGDTFITKEDQIIRLTSINAPELGNCGGKESQKELEKIISGKPLYLKIVFHDTYNRLVADVLTPEGSVSEKMLASGWAYYYRRSSSEPDSMKITGEKAREAKLGIYSPKCTQAKNPDRPECVIKANNALSSGNRQYHFPGCGQYNNTTVQLFMGDAWFCTEAEAKKAGYTKGADCFDKKWR